MKSIFNAFLCLCGLSLSVFCQEQMQKVMVGPFEGGTRILISSIEPTEEGYKMQSMIIDADSLKNAKEKPKSVTVDLTSTFRSLATGKKDQKILVLRWNEKEEIEMKCDGKWTKQDSAGDADKKIIETTGTVLQNVPLNVKNPTEITLSQEIMQKIETLLASLKSENFSCLRILK